MSTLNQDLNAIKAVEDTLTANKVANFAYTQEAYDNNDADGVEEYDFDNEQNIPVGSLSVLRVNETVLTKGWRSQASAITRMLMNHFLGRLSYNLNKLNDNVSNLLATLIAKAGNADGFATLDSNGRIPYSQLPESAIEYKGQWDASTNTPTLADGTGTKGDFYIVSVAGTQDLGSGNIQFFVNDRVIYDGSVWSRLSAGDVKSVNNITPVNGNITLGKGDIGLGNVDNTSDSDLPALNGINKFTTAGAYNILTSLAPAFDETVTYNLGNYVTYQGKLYKCTNAHTGAWSIADFSLVTLGEDLEKVAPLNYFLDVEQDQYNKWIDTKEIYRKVKSIPINSFIQNTSVPTNSSINAFCEYNGKLYVGTDSHGIYESSDGVTFTRISSFPSVYMAITLCEYNGKLYVGTDSHGIYESSDGVTFTRNTSFPTGYTVRTLCEYNGKLYAGTNSHGIYESSDGSAFTQNTSFPTNYSSFALGEYNGKLYAGTDNHGIYVSSDGSTFTQNTSFPTDYMARAFCEYNGKLYVGTDSQGIYESSDGSTFTQNTSFPTDYMARTLCAYNDKLYAGTSLYGIYESSDGSTFTQNTSFPTGYTVRALDEYNGKLYAGTGSHGTYISIVAVNSSMPNLTVDQSVDSLIEIKLVVDGNNINPLYAQKSGNQINLSLSSDSMSVLFPASDVYAVMEYTKP